MPERFPRQVASLLPESRPLNSVVPPESGAHSPRPPPAPGGSSTGRGPDPPHGLPEAHRLHQGLDQDRRLRADQVCSHQGARRAVRHPASRIRSCPPSPSRTRRRRSPAWRPPRRHPESRASCSVSPTFATCGELNTALGTNRWSLTCNDSGWSRLCCTTRASWLARCLSWQRAGDVAERPDPGRGCALVLVDEHETVVVHLDPGRVETEQVGVGRAAGREQQHVHVLGRPGPQLQTDAVAHRLDRVDRRRAAPPTAGWRVR